MSTKKFVPRQKKIIDTQPINRKEVLLLAIFVGHKTFKKFKDKQFICFYSTNFLVNISLVRNVKLFPPGSSTTGYKACKKFGYIFFDTFSFCVDCIQSSVLPKRKNCKRKCDWAITPTTDATPKILISQAH